MASQALASVFRGGLPTYREALTKLSSKTNAQARQKLHAGATTHTAVRTVAVVGTAAAASAASGMYPTYVGNRFVDVRLAGGVAVGLFGAYREMRGKRNTATSAVEGIADGMLASYVAEKALRFGERKKAEYDTASTSPASAATAANAAAVNGVERITWTPEPGFDGARVTGMREAVRLEDI